MYIVPGEEAGAGRCTYRAGGIEIVKNDTFRRQAVQIRCPQYGMIDKVHHFIGMFVG